MRTFFMVLGAASVVFGGYLLIESKRTRCNGKSSQSAAPAAGANGAGVTTGPTDASTASTTPVNNDTSMVEQYDGGKSLFPPMTYIMPAGTDWGRDANAVYQCPIF